MLYYWIKYRQTILQYLFITPEIDRLTIDYATVSLLRRRQKENFGDFTIVIRDGGSHD